jgi:hypothetical protein
MRPLLCRVGIHRPAWDPVRPMAALPTGETAWLQIRRCLDCGQPLRARGETAAPR